MIRGFLSDNSVQRKKNAIGKLGLQYAVSVSLGQIDFIFHSRIKPRLEQMVKSLFALPWVFQHLRTVLNLRSCYA